MPRVVSIFTHIAISPSTSLREFSTRYAIRAGRNSPDKEFRYLRTVIVTAGVHPRFSLELLYKSKSPHPLTFGHWPGIAPYTSAYAFAGSCVFDKQSHGVFSCGSPEESGPYPEVTAAILPSSLTMFLSLALVYSTCPPELVIGTI